MFNHIFPVLLSLFARSLTLTSCGEPAASRHERQQAEQRIRGYFQMSAETPVDVAHVIQHLHTEFPWGTRLEQIQAFLGASGIGTDNRSSTEWHSDIKRLDCRLLYNPNSPQKGLYSRKVAMDIYFRFDSERRLTDIDGTWFEM
jgi:hypothetical protein